MGKDQYGLSQNNPLPVYCCYLLYKDLNYVHVIFINKYKGMYNITLTQLRSLYTKTNESKSKTMDYFVNSTGSNISIDRLDERSNILLCNCSFFTGLCTLKQLTTKNFSVCFLGCLTHLRPYLSWYPQQHQSYFHCYGMNVTVVITLLHNGFYWAVNSLRLLQVIVFI